MQDNKLLFRGPAAALYLHIVDYNYSGIICAFGYVVVAATCPRGKGNPLSYNTGTAQKGLRDDQHHWRHRTSHRQLDRNLSEQNMKFSHQGLLLWKLAHLCFFLRCRHGDLPQLQAMFNIVQLSVVSTWAAHRCYLYIIYIYIIYKYVCICLCVYI